jgi:hypothetical protein
VSCSAPLLHAFQTFLKNHINVYSLAAQEPFRLWGDQIDGSFRFGDETYSVEAKWWPGPGASFVTNRGFTNEQLATFQRSKRVICMDSHDPYETLSREISFSQVLDCKIP